MLLLLQKFEMDVKISSLLRRRALKLAHLSEEMSLV